VGVCYNSYITRYGRAEQRPRNVICECERDAVRWCKILHLTVIPSSRKTYPCQYIYIYISNYIVEKFQRWVKICKQVPALPTRKHQNAAVLQTSIRLSTTLCLWLYEIPLIFIIPINVCIRSCEKLRITVSQWGEKYPTNSDEMESWLNWSHLV
jgi:hypothetical protein